MPVLQGGLPCSAPGFSRITGARVDFPRAFQRLLKIPVAIAKNVTLADKDLSDALCRQFRTLQIGEDGSVPGCRVGEIRASGANREFCLITFDDDGV